ncbi:hypothetical protein B0H12DRAFT_478496 [Mycena haematopus]|nr:hypothetical protein B0H12DRAFT_478496 [Mycena haematopus]
MPCSCSTPPTLGKTAPSSRRLQRRVSCVPALLCSSILPFAIARYRDPHSEQHVDRPPVLCTLSAPTPCPRYKAYDSDTANRLDTPHSTSFFAPSCRPRCRSSAWQHADVPPPASGVCRLILVVRLGTSCRETACSECTSHRTGGDSAVMTRAALLLPRARSSMIREADLCCAGGVRRPAPCALRRADANDARLYNVIGIVPRPSYDVASSVIASTRVSLYRPCVLGLGSKALPR